jgi:hypothetical protein
MSNVAESMDACKRVTPLPLWRGRGPFRYAFHVLRSTRTQFSCASLRSEASS